MIKINLLPPEKRKKLKKVKPARTKAAAAAGTRFRFGLKLDSSLAIPAALALLFVIAAGGSFLWISRQEALLTARRDDARRELVVLNGVIARVEDLKLQTNRVRQRMEVIREVDRNRYLWPQLLDQISSALPSYTWLEVIAEVKPFPQMKLRLEGTTMSNLILSRFLADLERSPLLSKVSLVSSTERRQDNFETKYFIIECACALNAPTDSTVAPSKP
jgi:Tfp pilus assembly protein PilN